MRLLLIGAVIGWVLNGTFMLQRRYTLFLKLTMRCREGQEPLWLRVVGYLV